MPRRSYKLPGLVLAALVGAACHAPATPLRPAVAKPSAKASVEASVEASTAATSPNTATAADVLQRPADTTELTGTLSIDASYGVASGAGTLISNNGGSLLAVGGKLVANNGGGLLSDAGGGLVARASGNIIANNGGGLLSDAGGGLLSDAGAGIVGKVKYHVLDTGLTPTFGQEAPAAGMLIQAVDMTTGHALPLGTDAAGQPAYAVYSNLAGAYTLYLPRTLATNVRLLASVPGSSDPRVRYAAIAPPGSSHGVVIDEDAAAVTRYVRQVMGARFAKVLDLRAAEGNGGVPTDEAVDGFTGGTGLDFFKDLMKELFANVRANPRLQQADMVPLALLLADVLLAHADGLDPDAVAADGDATAASAMAATRSSIDQMSQVIKASREAVIRLGTGKTPGEVAAYFAAKPYLQRANAFHARYHPSDPSPYYVIEKASDLTDFIAQEYLTLSRPGSYGCQIGLDCASPRPLINCDLTTGCFPDGGLPLLGPDDALNLAKAVASDVGLPPGDLDTLALGSQILIGGLAAQAFDPTVKAQLICLVRNDKAEGEPTSCQ